MQLALFLMQAIFLMAELFNCNKIKLKKKKKKFPFTSLD